MPEDRRREKDQRQEGYGADGDSSPPVRGSMKTSARAAFPEPSFIGAIL